MRVAAADLFHPYLLPKTDTFLLKKSVILHYTHSPCRLQHILLAPKIGKERSFLNQVGSTHGFCLKREHMSTCSKLKYTGRSGCRLHLLLLIPSTKMFLALTLTPTLAVQSQSTKHGALTAAALRAVRCGATKFTREDQSRVTRTWDATHL